jgi:hypothetical protein
MKVLTVRQPWASLIIAGRKDVESRTRYTYHRGRLAIHAGLQIDPEGVRAHPHLARQLEVERWRGFILGTVTLVDCIDDSSSEWANPGAWHWLLSNPRPYARPVPAKGKLGLWNWQR